DAGGQRLTDWPDLVDAPGPDAREQTLVVLEEGPDQAAVDRIARTDKSDPGPPEHGLDARERRLKLPRERGLQRVVDRHDARGAGQDPAAAAEPRDRRPERVDPLDRRRSERLLRLCVAPAAADEVSRAGQQHDPGDDCCPEPQRATAAGGARGTTDHLP